MGRHRRNSSLVGLFLLLSGIGFSPNVVFCVGDGGHRALELFSWECCPSSSGDSDSAAPNGHCAAECTDVPIVSSVILNSHGNDLRRDGVKRIFVAPAVLQAVRAGVPQAETVSRLDFGRPPSLPAPRQRHTTVQICGTVSAPGSTLVQNERVKEVSVSVTADTNRTSCISGASRQAPRAEICQCRDAAQSSSLAERQPPP
jgi:hypothetical protein